jgi:DNA-directed RNA polymerase specialized sigma24 family protein
MSNAKRPTAPVRSYAERARLVKHIRRTLGGGAVANDVAAEVCLEFYSATYGVAWPSEARLAELLRTSTRTIKRAVRDLEEHGFFHVKRAGLKGQNHYIPRFDCLSPAADDRTDSSGHAAADGTDLSHQENSEVTDLSHQKTAEVTDLSPKMGQICPAEVPDLSPESSYESPQESSYSLVAASAAPASGSAGPDPIDLAFERFRHVAGDLGLPVPNKLTDTRRRKLRARLKGGGLDVWETALEKLAASPFLCGEKTDFRADLDFMLQESSFTKLLEGRYDPSPNEGRSAPKSRTRSAAEAMIGRYGGKSAARSYVERRIAELTPDGEESASSLFDQPGASAEASSGPIIDGE